MKVVFNKIFKKLFNELRKKDKDFTQAKLAQEINVNPKTIINWLNRNTLPKTRELVERVANFFNEKLQKNLAVEDFLGGATTPTILRKPRKKRLSKRIIKPKKALPERLEKTEEIKVAEEEVKKPEELPLQLFTDRIDKVVKDLGELKVELEKITEQSLTSQEEELLAKYRKLPKEEKVRFYDFFKSKLE